MFGKCSVCAEKDARIQDLKQEISRLYALLRPEVRHVEAPLAIEANQLLDGGSNPVINLIKNKEVEEHERTAEETQAEAMFNGTY